MQISDILLYASNEWSKKEIKKIIPFTKASKVKYLEIHITKEAKDLSTENYKTMLKDIRN